MSYTIIQEIRKTRDEYARQFNNDLHQLCLDLRCKQEFSGVLMAMPGSSAVGP